MFGNKTQESNTNSGAMIVLGFEGSANKLAIGIVRDDGTILSNVRHTVS